VVANFEYRTRPVEILACQLAGAVFFDAGDAFDGWGDFQPKQSAGFGLRVVFPQIDRTVLRADWGFPLMRGYRDPDSLPGDIVVTFKQAFPIPDVPSRAESIE
jgi:outer membrane protein assembly factor BamA